MNYRCKHFKIQELVGPEVFKARGEAAWELLRPDSLRMLDALREKFGAITVNNWFAGGTFKESGLRDFSTSIGAGYSQHKFGSAFDCKFSSHTPQEVHAYILAHPEEFPLITTLEDIASTPSWLHFDTRNNPDAGIRIVKP